MWLSNSNKNVDLTNGFSVSIAAEVKKKKKKKKVGFQH